MNPMYTMCQLFVNFGIRHSPQLEIPHRIEEVYWALTQSPSPVDPSAIIESFQHYLKQEGTKARRAEFVGILETHLKDRGFCSDMQPLLRTGINYDPQTAGSYVKAKLLNLRPE